MVDACLEPATLREYLEFLVRRGVSSNVASFVGAGGVRANVLGFADRRPTPDELARMQALVRQAMADGAVGLSAALIYAPDSYADTAELIALAQAAAEYDGLFAAHLRSEGETFLEALDEFLTIVEESGIRGEIYHLKASGRRASDRAARRIDDLAAHEVPRRGRAAAQAGDEEDEGKDDESAAGSGHRPTIAGALA